MTFTLTSNSELKCPHGGTVNAVPSNARVSVDGGAPLHPSDPFTVSGCPFQIPAAPSPIPSPCITVVVVKPDLRVASGGVPTLSSASVGICFAATGLPQGEMVKVPVQSRVKTS